MKATSIAKFLNILNSQQIVFTIDEVHDKTYEEAFHVSKKPFKSSNNKADGVYLSIWVCKKSLMQDIVEENIGNLTSEITPDKVEVFNAPFQPEDTSYWLYIIKIED